MEKYTQEVQRILNSCENLAFKFSHRLIGSEHLLLAILKQTNDFSQNLNQYGLTYDKLYKKVKDLYSSHEKEPLYMQYTIELRNVLENAKMISNQYHEEAIGINALSIAILISENSLAYEILDKAKVDIAMVNKIVQAKMIKKSELNSINDLHLLSNVKKDPLIGRESELTQLINALSRRNKPNAILVGEPGVGKTAIVEELAKLIENNQVPTLKNKSIYELDLAATVSGTKYRGEFEEKIKKILSKVIDDGHCILFIDEIHNIIKAGGAEGAIDASNIIKPYLSRGQIQLIGATTEEEFQGIFEKDKALKRRFQIIRIKPSTNLETKNILKQTRHLYEDFYKLKIDNEVIDYLVDQADVLISNMFFPDKAIDLLDNTCVIAQKDITKDDVDRALEIYYKVHNCSLYKTSNVINRLKKELFGQNDVIRKLEEQLSLLDRGIIDNEHTMLNLMFLGPSGVGKSLTAKIIGDEYFGKDNVIYLDMSSFQDFNAVNKLNGISYGYSNQEINTYLVRNLKNHPYCLIILDEIEKANNEVLDFFLQIMDKGFFDTIKGERIYCNKAMIIMISNYGYEKNLFFDKCQDKGNIETIKNKLKTRFRNEFLSRIDDIIVFEYLKRQDCLNIAQNYFLSFDYSCEYSKIEEIVDKNSEESFKYGARAIKKECKKTLIRKYLTKQQ